MRKKRLNSFLLLLGSWGIIVLVFAILYWKAWDYSSDAFILNNQFNLNPVDELQRRVLVQGFSDDSGLEPNVASVKSFNLDEMMNVVAELDKLAGVLNRGLEPLKKKEELLEKERVRVAELHHSAMSKNIDAYRSEMLSPVEASVRHYERVLSELEKRDKPYLNVALAEARVDLANARLLQAERGAEVSAYIVDNIGKFADPGTTADMLELDAKLQGISVEFGGLQREIGELRVRAFSTISEWKKWRGSRLELIDFVYFSAGVSTSTTFGDIIPNSRVVRVLALIQLFISVVVLGLLVSVLGRYSGMEAAEDHDVRLG